MKISYRLTLMFISLAIILVIGRWSIGNFEFGVFRNSCG